MAYLDPPHAGGGGPIYFAAALHPNRSLSRFGFRVVMVAAAASAFAIGTIFLLAGAWPVIGFCGLEVILLYLAFRLNYRSGRMSENLRLTRTDLEVIRISPYGKKQTWHFEPTWLQVLMDDPPEHQSKLRLASHGRSLVIGSFLTPEERLEVACALRDALYDWRHRRA
jgi:uncharacterized membrane protein